MNKYITQKSLTLIFIIITTSCLLLTACANTSSPTMKTNIQAVSYLNPNIYNQASPVVISIYQLKSATTFQQTNFFTLYNNPTATLASDLLDKLDIEIRPQQKQILSIILSPVTNYIGVLAAFRDPDQAQWRQIIAVTPGKNIKLKINITSQSIHINLQ